jgi:hypothetical protein
VDDAIVVVENIVRHARMGGAPGGLAAIAIRAVDEVGNPTILATLAVVAAILPMAFVRGMTGPYMRPIPVGASAAMVFSLVVAFVVTPWAAIRLLRPAAHRDHGEDRLTRLYRRVMGPLIASGRRRAIFLAGVAALLLAAVALLPARTRDGEDDAVRQQERVRGHDRHARGHGRSRRRHASRRPWRWRPWTTRRWSTSSSTWARRPRTTSMAWSGTIF